MDSNGNNKAIANKTILELISIKSKFAGPQANTQKSIAFLCTSSEWVEFEIQLTMAFKWSIWNLGNYVLYLYEENYKISMDNAKELMNVSG